MEQLQPEDASIEVVVAEVLTVETTAATAQEQLQPVNSNVEVIVA